MFNSKKSKLIALIVLVISIGLTPCYEAKAIIASTLKLSKQDLKDLLILEKYLNGLRTMEARFLQMSSDGSYSEGVIYISRPGRMRIEYDPPNPILVIADGSSLIYVDKEMNQATAVFLRLTPADFILRRQLSFSSDDILITGFHRSPGIIRLSLVKADNPLDGKITLIFSDTPLELRKWTVNDAQGIKTTVSLLGPRFAVNLDRSLFNYEMPNPVNESE
ncbi:MAG: hypothetical protein CMF69_06365 [Magnetovibrio sp.]|nr:hypothetical protein [Magnetovibrio sp.]|tara:strand:- start:1204 stop:1863 length:660 start_codon:yes stop_codon:yes gene_type:complete